MPSLTAPSSVPADIEAKEMHEKDVLHQVWVVTDPEVISQVNAEMAAKTNLIIADGHHRYETALNYQEEMKAKHPEAAGECGFQLSNGSYGEYE